MFSGESEKELIKEPERLEKESLSRAGQERERESRLYFEFDSPAIRDQAIETLKELRKKYHEYDDRFRFFVDCKPDPERPEIGMEVIFSRNPQNSRDIFEQLLAEQGLVPREEYKTAGGEPQPEETKINHAS